MRIGLLTSRYKRIPRSIFWVVTTLVGNSLVYTVGLAALLSIVKDIFVGSIVGRAVWQVVVLAIASFLGTRLSLDFIRNHAKVADPLDCVVPSIATFAGCVAGLLFLQFRFGQSRGLPAFAAYTGYGVVPVVIFSYMSQRFFSQRAPPKSRRFEVKIVQGAVPVEPLSVSPRKE